MTVRSAKGRAALGTIAGAASLVACADLFHTTEWTTLCDVDAAACGLADAATAAEDGSVQDGGSSLCQKDPQEVAGRVCGRLGACFGTMGTSRYGECLVQAGLAYDCTANPALRVRGARASLWTCLAAATTCEEMRASVLPAGPQTCKTSASVLAGCGTSTNATTLVECVASVPTPRSIEPCGLLGRTCSAALTDGNSTCEGGLTSRCDTLKQPACSGTSAVSCETPAAGNGPASGVDVGLDCASMGAGGCVGTANGPACLPTANLPACAGDRALRCEGKVARGCVSGRAYELDCSAFGLDCVAPANAQRGGWDIASWCRNPLAECDDSAAERDTCSTAGLLVTCVRGAKKQITCGELGLGPCKVPVAGASGTCTGGG